MKAMAVPRESLACLAVLFASAAALGQPDAGPDKDQRLPGVHEIEVPTRLLVESKAGSFRVSVDPKGKKKVGVQVRAGMILGTEMTLTMAQGGKEIEHQVGLSSGTSFDHGESIFPAEGHQGARVEVRLKLFETDVPVRSHWSPAGASYRVLWEGTLVRDLPGP